VKTCFCTLLRFHSFVSLAGSDKRVPFGSFSSCGCLATHHTLVSSTLRTISLRLWYSIISRTDFSFLAVLSFVLFLSFASSKDRGRVHV
jgi:hypothetical protein